MPVFPTILQKGVRAPDEDKGIPSIQNEVLYFVERHNGATLRPDNTTADQYPYGGMVVYFETADPIAGWTRDTTPLGPAGSPGGWQYTFQTTTTPTERPFNMVQHFGDKVQQAFRDSEPNERFVRRDFFGPPNMGVVQSRDMVNGLAGSELSRGDPVLANFAFIAFDQPVYADGLAFEYDGGYDANDLRGATGLRLTPLPGTTVTQVYNAASPPAVESSVNIKVSSTGQLEWVAGSSNTANAVQIPDGYTVRALLRAPGVGFSFSAKHDNATGSTESVDLVNDLAWPADTAFGNALIDKQPAIYLVFYIAETRFRLL